MSELRNRTLPPPPRHPISTPPSPGFQPRSSVLNAQPPPTHPSHAPSRPPPSPRQNARLEYFGPEPIPSQVAAPLDAPPTPPIQRLPPPVPTNRPGNPDSLSEDLVASTSSVNAKPVGSPELPQPAPRSSSPNSIANSSTIPPPSHHARKARSLTSDSAYETTLSEKELRDLYDDEEIDRFLRFFSTVRYSNVCRFMDSPCL